MKAVFFDAHNVIYDREIDRRRFTEFLLERGLLNIPQEYTDSNTRHVYSMASCGLITRDAYFDAVLDIYGITSPDDRLKGRQILAFDHGDIRLFADVSRTLLELKRRGHKLGIITDTIAPTTEKLQWFHEQGLTMEWDAFASSVDVGVCKPDSRIYIEALTQASVTSADSVFVGHKMSELIGAKSVGMVTVVFNPDPDANGDYFISSLYELTRLPLLQ